MQDELSLNWYDYGARNYDASLGRWMNLDNHADSYFSVTPYSSFANNPISFVDPTGEDILFWRWVGGISDDSDGKWEQVTYDKLDKRTQEALSGFVNTKSGKAFLGLFANKGDKIGDVEFEEDGIYSNHNYNFSEFSSYGSPGGSTGRPNQHIRQGPSEENGKGPSFIDFNVTFNLAREGDDNSSLSRISTIGHENFLHISQYLDDYVKAFENREFNKADEIYDKDSEGNPKGSRDHFSFYYKTSKAKKYYTFLNQLKNVFNPKEVQNYINKERKRQFNHAKAVFKRKKIKAKGY